METNYGLEVSKPPGMNVEDLETVVGREVPKENATAPKSYGKRLYAKAKRIYNEAKESFGLDEGLKGYNMIAAPIVMALGAATGATEMGLVVGAGAFVIGALLSAKYGIYTDAKRNENLAMAGFLL